MEDKNLDDLLRSGFDQQPKRPVPKDLWERLSRDLPSDDQRQEAPSAEKEQLLDQALHQALTPERPLHRAPAGIWERIEQALDGDEQLDAVLRQGFAERQSGVSAPERIWHALSKQLTIDKAWVGVRTELDSMHHLYRLRSRLTGGGLAAVLALLLWWKGCQTPTVGTPSVQNLTNAEQEHVAEHKTTNDTSVLSLVEIFKNSHLPINSTFTPQPNIEERSQSGNSTLQNGPYPRPKKNGASGIKNAQGKSVKRSARTNAQGYSHDKQMVLNRQVPSVQNRAEEATESVQSHTDTTLMEGVRIAALRAELLPASKDEYVPEPGALEQWRKAATKGRGRWEVGLSYELGTQVLVNAETRASLRTTSLSKTRFMPAQNMGFVAQYHAAPRHSVQLGLMPRAEVRQRYYNYTSEGKYVEKRVRMDYLKLAVSYQLSLGKRPAQGGVFIRTGIYVSHLLQRQELYNHQTSNWTLDNTKLYNRWDAGARLGLGYSRSWGAWSLDLGLQAEAGFSNIFAGNDKIPAYFYQTHLIGLSGFAQVKYRFAYKNSDKQ